MFDTLKRAVPPAWRPVLKVARARVFEAGGSFRYSKPALNGLEMQLLPYLPKHGTFLEIGANDGFSQSNTYFLARALGWKGILIEPVPRLYERCRRLRSESVVFNRACVAPGGPASVSVVDRGLMSVVLGMQSQREEADRLTGPPTQPLTVPSATLSELIDQTPFARLDFISIDVEGAELEVLKGLDLDRHTPGWLLVETKHLDDVTRLLAGHGELVAKLTHHDYLFRGLRRPEASPPRAPRSARR